MLKIILIVVAVLIAALLIYAATRPDSFRVERSIVIQAAPATIHAHINDFHAWGAWSPWEKKDPAMQREFTGNASGVGAVYGWSGNNTVGSGRMEILESEANRILIKLDFLSPFEAHNFAEYTLTPVADGTELRWAMYGPSNFVTKLMHVIFSMDKMVGPDFEAGLASLKRLSEQPALANP